MFFRGTLLSAMLCLVTAHTAAAEPTDGDSWRQWRGPYNTGVAAGDAPTNFSATEKVKWRTPIPGKGHSTPVVWGDVIYLTTAVAKGSPRPAGADRGPRGGVPGPRAGGRGAKGRGRGGGRPGGGSGGGGELVETDFLVMALNKNTGAVLWQKTAVTATPHEGYHRQYGSFASNSPVTDGETLIANFGSRGVYAYDLDGNLKWSKDLGRLQMRLQFGEGVAPVLHEDYLIVQNDHEGRSYIVVLDKNDGAEIWRAERDERSSWPQPVVVDYGGRKQVVTSSTRIRSYDLATGELVWEAGGLGGNAIPAVVNVDNEMVIAMTGWRDPNLLAVKLGGKGDLTGNPEFISWSNQRGNSYSASPVLHDGILYFVTDRGMVSAFDARTGEKFYNQQRLPQSYTFKASPVAANGKLYLASEEGDVIVLKLGKTYEVLATNKMGEETFISSPFIVGGDLFLRSQDELFCISDN